MKIAKPHIIARIHFFETEKGGRKSPTPKDKHRCIFVLKGKNYDCQLNLNEIGSIKPGETKSVPIVFFRPLLLEGKLSENTNFKLRENIIIADGVIEKVKTKDCEV